MFRVSVIFVVILAIGIQGGAIKLTEDEVNSQDYMMFPDGDGKLHLIHLKEDRYQPESRFSVKQHVHFLLYTRSNLDKPQELNFYNLTTIWNSLLDPTKDTFVVTHGWSSGPDKDAVVLIRKALLESGDYNVIALDWAYGASYNYIAARSHAATAGTHLGEFIKILIQNKNLSLRQIHLIGHSLGAHVMGFAGKQVKKITDKKVAQIVGLDPALPLYKLNYPKGRLDKTDADYVEIVHTNGGKLAFWDYIGHADFYPNGGKYQPGCGMDMFGSCSHSRAYEYYAESIVGKDIFQSLKCLDLWHVEKSRCKKHETREKYLMGGTHYKFKYKGIFHLKTASASPYALDLKASTNAD